MSIEHENLDDIARIQDESGLEQYGVWVKKTPQESPAKEMPDFHEDTDTSDIFLDDIDFDNLPDATDISSSAEAEGIIDSDLNGKIEETLDADTDIDSASELMTDTADFEDFAADLQGFQMHTEDEVEQTALPSVEKAASEKDTATSSDTAMEDIEWDEYMGDSETPEDSLLDEKPLDINLSFEDNGDNFETITPDFPKEESVSEAGFETEDVSDMFTSDSEDDTNSETDSASAPKDQIPDITEIPEMADLGEMEEFAESGSYDFPVDFSSRSEDSNDNSTQNTQSDESENAATGGQVIENIDINEFNTDMDPVQQDEPQQQSASDTVYNIAVHADDESEEEKSSAPAAAENPAVQAMSSALFEKIIGELSLLRQDITDLKTDLNALKTADTEDVVREEEPGAKTGSGFFSDEEEDETIALSGDELNNILTSADFTAADPGQDIREESDNLDESSFQEDENITENAGERPVLNLRETELTEPVLDDINFDLDEDNQDELPNEIEIPVGDDLVVDSANDDFFAEDDTPKDIDDTAVNYLSETPASDEDIPEETALDTDTANNEPAETENTAAVEEENECIFDDTDIAAAAEDMFSDMETKETEAETSSELDNLSDSAEPEFNIEEPVTEPAKDSAAEDMFIAEENEITEEQTEKEISPAFDMDFEEEETSEDLSQFDPIGEVFNSKQWVSEEESAAEEAEKAAEESAAEDTSKKASETAVDTAQDGTQIPQNMREEIKSVLAYMDQLLENLPEEKIVEFARSEHFPVYKKLFTELGLS